MSNESLPALPWSDPLAELGDAFAIEVAPTPLPDPYWVIHNQALAAQIGLPADWHVSGAWLQAMSGNARLPGSHWLASVYSGHQFGVWAGQLGDGRALLLGALQGQELQLKGAGRTPFSRMGDGRAVLRSSIREFLACEALHALGIPSTRALCLTGSPFQVRREVAESVAVLCRSAPSFLRFGHFEHFSARGDLSALRRLADCAIERFYPECVRRPGDHDYALLLAQVVQRSAALVAQWQASGFCHGVLNTDNMSLLGLTLDYGPFQFLDGYDPGHICNHTDQTGRYAFDRQPEIVRWNLFALGQALLPLIGDSDAALGALHGYAAHYQQAWRSAMARKLGADHPERVDADIDALLGELLHVLSAERIDYSIFWRRLSHWMARRDLDDHSVDDLFVDAAPYRHWLLACLDWHGPGDWQARGQRMLASNPKFVLRNHIAQQVIESAQNGDFAPLHQALVLLQQPFDEHPGCEDWAGFAPDWARYLQVSCSS